MMALKVAALLLALVVAVSADPGQKSYQIKGKPVANVVEGVAQMNRFLSERMKSIERCQRLSVFLDTLEKKPTGVNTFEVADIGLARKEDIEKRYSGINVERLRDLYMEAIQSHINSKHISEPLVELVDCLKGGFRDRDVKARSFLNGAQLNRILSQFNSIKSQPMRLLDSHDKHFRHPELRLGQLEESIKQSVSQWMAGDKVHFEQVFSDPPAHKEPEAEVAVKQVKQVQQAPVIEQQQAPAVEQQPPVDYDEPEVAISYKEPVYAEEPEVDYYAPPPPPAEAYAYAGQYAGQPPQAEVAQAQAHPQDPEEQEYLETLWGSLMAVYESLPLEAQSGDRCQAYNQLIAADRATLYSDHFLDQLVAGVASRLANQGPAKEAFVPDDEARDNFVFIVDTFDPLRAGAEVWLDMDGCVSKWFELDAEAQAYLTSDKRAHLIDQLTGEETAPAAPADLHQSTGELPAVAH